MLQELSINICLKVHKFKLLNYFFSPRRLFLSQKIEKILMTYCISKTKYLMLSEKMRGGLFEGNMFKEDITK